MHLAHKGLLAKLNMLLDKKSTTIETRGARCLFVPLTQQWGAKLYYGKDTRDECHALQLLAYQKKVAPRVGIKFDLKGRSKPYGYITQIAVMPFKEYDQSDVKPVSVMLYDRMFRRGLNTNDLHGWNIGKIGDRYVCIDFDNVWKVDPKKEAKGRPYDF